MQCRVVVIVVIESGGSSSWYQVRRLEGIVATNNSSDSSWIRMTLPGTTVWLINVARRHEVELLSPNSCKSPLGNMTILETVQHDVFWQWRVVDVSTMEANSKVITFCKSFLNGANRANSSQMSTKLNNIRINVISIIDDDVASDNVDPINEYPGLLKISFKNKLSNSWNEIDGHFNNIRRSLIIFIRN